MAYTTGDLVSRVQRRIRDTGYSSSEILEYLNDTQNDIANEYRLPFFQATQAYTLTSGVADITNGSGLPATFAQAIDLTLTSGSEKVLKYYDFTEIERMYPNVTDTTSHPANIPSSWYRYGDNIYVFPAPNSAYTVSLRYYKKPTELDADADVPEIPSEFAELLVLGAAYRVLQVKDNYDQAGILQNKFDELLQKLVVKYTQAQVGTATRMRINRHAMGKAHF